MILLIFLLSTNNRSSTKNLSDTFFNKPLLSTLPMFDQVGTRERRKEETQRKRETERESCETREGESRTERPPYWTHF